MSSEVFAKRKLAVLIDETQPLFSDRLMVQLSNSGLDIERLSLSMGIIGFVKWAWKLSTSKARIVHFLGGHHHIPFYIAPKLLGKKVVIHWIGSDVLLAASNKRSACRDLFMKIAWQMTDLHLAVSVSLAKELEALGMKVVVVPLVPDFPQSKESDIRWPSSSKVYVYLPEARQEFYGAETVFRLAQEMADTEFMITGHSGKNAPQLPNLKFLGWVDDIETVWREVKVYLRLTQHDGMPLALIEALLRGKYVIWSNQFPHCIQARSYDEAKAALKATLLQEQPNLAGMAYARQQFAASNIVQELTLRYSELISKS